MTLPFFPVHSIFSSRLLSFSLSSLVLLVVESQLLRLILWAFWQRNCDEERGCWNDDCSRLFQTYFFGDSHSSSFINLNYRHYYPQIANLTRKNFPFFGLLPNADNHYHPELKASYKENN